MSISILSESRDAVLKKHAFSNSEASLCVYKAQKSSDFVHSYEFLKEAAPSKYILYFSKYLQDL